MQYSIVQHSDLSGLNRLVNKAMQKGWQPQGGVAVSSVYSFGRSTIYCQAMVIQSDQEITMDNSDAGFKKESSMVEKVVGTVLVLAIVAAIVKYVF